MVTIAMKRTLLRILLVLAVIAIGLTVVVLRDKYCIEPHNREMALKQDLHLMRKLIDQYAEDKKQLPQSLDDLVSQGYMRDIPIDPITQKKDWDIEVGEDQVSAAGRGIVDLHSNALGKGSDGHPYKEY